MSEQTGSENVSDGLTAYSVDDENQLQPEDTLVPGGDPVEQGYETSNRLKSATFYNEDEDGESHEETIDERISQEVPDPDSAYGAPDNESGLDGPPMVGGDDVDAIPADQNFVGSSDELQQLAASDDGAESDTDAQMIARETEEPNGGTGEEAAMHIVTEE
ncbi:hypothetical protein K0651_03080 [Ornithinimicrobium sp. Arc0846-15]|nr:hypothetical protein [Ornithinimicrobium laminariae]